MIGFHPAGVVYSFIGVFGGLKLFHSGFKDLQLERLMGGTAVSKARSVAVGGVELSGAARPGDDPVRDPIFEEACVYYHVVVKEERGSGKNAHWVVVYDNHSALPFYLEDDTGRILVYPGGAQLYLENAVDVHLGGTFDGAADNQIIKFASLVAGGLGRKHLTAHIVREATQLCVYGFAGPDLLPASGPTFEDRLKQLKADPAVQQLPVEQWDALVAKTRREWEAAQAAVPAPPIVVRKPEDGPLVISDEPVGKLVSSLEWRSLLKVVGGPALTLASIAYLVSAYRTVAGWKW